MIWSIKNVAISMLIIGFWTTLGIAVAYSPEIPFVWKCVAVYFGGGLGLMFWSTCPFLDTK